MQSTVRMFQLKYTSPGQCGLYIQDSILLDKALGLYDSVALALEPRDQY